MMFHDDSPPEHTLPSNASVSAPAANLGNPSFSRRFPKAPPDVLDFVLFLPGIWLACSLGLSLRLIGTFFVVAPLGVCLLYAVLRRTIPPRLLTAYIGFSIFIAALSKFQLMPNSWQVHFLEDAIVRQLVPLLGFFAVAWASKAYFRRRLIDGDIIFAAPIFLFCSLIIAPAVMAQQGLSYQGDTVAYSVTALYGSLTNNIAIATFFLMSAIFRTKDLRRYLSLMFVLGVAASTHFIQFHFLAVAVLATLFGFRGRVVIVTLIAAMLIIYVVAFTQLLELLANNPNSGIRLVFLADAFRSAIDTAGMGIGYGKESVRWVYHFPNMPAWTFRPDPGMITHARMLELMSTGVENSFVESLLRTGVIGFALFSAAFFATFPPRNLPPALEGHAAAVFSMMLIGCFVNSSLESPLSAVGMGFVYGYLISLRGSASRPLRSVAEDRSVLHFRESLPVHAGVAARTSAQMH